MANNAHKLWVQDTINQHSITRVAEAIQNTGASLPCSVVSVSGQIVTVKFEVDSSPWTLPQIAIPIATWSYDWIPVQPGDMGLTVPSDVYLGGISGLGGGVLSKHEIVFPPVMAIKTPVGSHPVGAPVSVCVPVPGI